jgi:hypothetical protein
LAGPAEGRIADRVSLEPDPALAHLRRPLARHGQSSRRALAAGTRLHGPDAPPLSPAPCVGERDTKPLRPAPQFVAIEIILTAPETLCNGQYRVRLQYRDARGARLHAISHSAMR